MGKAVLDLQNKLPSARVVYASATGASEPKNMIYMSRLGIWGEGTPFRTFDDFLHAIEKRFVENLLAGKYENSPFWICNLNVLFIDRGVGAMEIVAMDMKVSGMYIARQLSFSGVSFRIEEINLDDDFKLVYNKAAKLVSYEKNLWNPSHYFYFYFKGIVHSKMKISPWFTHHQVILGVFDCLHSDEYNQSYSISQKWVHPSHFC